MGSNTPQLPIIYLSDETLKQGSSEWIKARSHVRKALEDYSCFEVSYDRVSMDLTTSFFEAVKELFELPLETKQRNVIPKPYIGYESRYNIYESMGIGAPNVSENVDEFTQQLWPEGNQRISNTILKFANKLAELDQMMRKMVMESFGIEKYIDEHLASTNYRMRIIKYTAPLNVDDADGDGDVEDSKLGLPSHTDKYFFTTLYQHEIEGFELKTKDDKWIRVKPSPNSFLFMAGDAISALMNDRLAPAYHRVRVTEKKRTRYSAAFFTCPNPGYIIDAPKELVDEKHPRVFKPFEFFEFLNFFRKEADAGRGPRSALHAYCAV